MQEALFFLAEKIISTVFLFWGISLLIQTNLWLTLIKWLISQKEETFNMICLTMGSVFLPLGITLIFVHNNWAFDPSVIVTIIAWVTVIKCSIFILWPKLTAKCQALYKQFENYLKWYLRICGSLYIILGLLVASNFFM